MFTHQDAVTETNFVEAETSSGNVLRASPGHYVWAVPQVHQRGINNTKNQSNYTDIFHLKCIRVLSLSFLMIYSTQSKPSGLVASHLKG